MNREKSRKKDSQSHSVVCDEPNRSIIINDNVLLDLGDEPEDFQPQYVRACVIIGCFTLNNRIRPNSRMFLHASIVLEDWKIS